MATYEEARRAQDEYLKTVGRPEWFRGVGLGTYVRDGRMEWRLEVRARSAADFVKVPETFNGVPVAAHEVGDSEFA